MAHWVAKKPVPFFFNFQINNLILNLKIDILFLPVIVITVSYVMLRGVISVTIAALQGVNNMELSEADAFIFLHVETSRDWAWAHEAELIGEVDWRPLRSALNEIYNI